MNIEKSAELNEKKRQTNENEQEIIETSAKEKDIPLANDVLRKLLEWVPVRNLPNVILAGPRRFWVIGDEELEGRKYSIQEIRLNENPEDRMEVTRRIDGVTQLVPFAEVEPPQNVKLERIWVDTNIGDAAMDFLRISRELYVGAIFRFEWNVTNGEFLDSLLGIIDTCTLVVIYYLDSAMTHDNFFNKTAIINCRSLALCYIKPDFDPLAVFDWLHLPSTDPKVKRQIFLPLPQFSTVLLAQIKKRFSNDDTKRKFVVRFKEENFPMEELNLRMENELTGEILFTKPNNDSYHVEYVDLIRCGQSENGTVAYEDIDYKLFTYIAIISS